MSELANKMDLKPKHLESTDKYVDGVMEMIGRTNLFEYFNLDEINVFCRHMHCYATPPEYLNKWS